MNLTGAMLIDGADVMGTHGTVYAHNPATGERLEPAFGAGGQPEVDRACALAAAAFGIYRETTQAVRAAFLRSIGAGLLELGDALMERAQAETGLPRARLEGERGRTIGQLEMFAKIVEDGRWMGVVMDTALPDRKPLPRPDLRLRRIPLGSVAIFGASNFPLAFSVAGGDTASALAAGCPVVMKSHSAHPGTSELVGRVIQKAVAEHGLPHGVFALLVGDGIAIGQELVRHPEIKAVGFTGSRSGGLSLMRAAANRLEPIPVYAEMSSVNPVFVLPGALQENAETLAKSFVDSLVLGVGQFCTNPGLALGVAGEALDRFSRAAAAEVDCRSSAAMLTPGIQKAYEEAVHRLRGADAVTLLASVAKPAEAVGSHGCPALFSVNAGDLLKSPELGAEVFGPSSMLVQCRDLDEMRAVAEAMEGQLTATILATADDEAIARSLLPILERKVGRIVYNGFPTGVEVSSAMVHGGPFPATSDARTTSVGAGAIERFLRPVSYQNLPSTLLPDALKPENPLSIPRLVDFAPQG